MRAKGAIAMSHRGNFTVGEPGVYTIVVSNIGGTASSGLIEVTTSFFSVSATGTGWSCQYFILSVHFPPVLYCFHFSDTELRTADTVATELGLPIERVEKALTSLEAVGQVKRVGLGMWGPTEDAAGR
jgi:uncharacterized repeat protein (TIGR01451 family)